MHMINWKVSLMRKWPGDFVGADETPGTLKYIHTCAERFWSGDGQILTFPLCYCKYVYICDCLVENLGLICPVGEDRSGSEHPVSVWTWHGKLGVGPIPFGADFAPTLLPCMCVEANFLSASFSFCLHPLCTCVNVPLHKDTSYNKPGNIIRLKIQKSFGRGQGMVCICEFIVWFISCLCNCGTICNIVL